MLEFLSWYIVLVLLGWISFPLVFHLFPRLAERGYSFSRIVGLLVWAYLFWLFGSFGIAQNDLGGLLLALAGLAALTVWALTRSTPSSSSSAPGRSSPALRGSAALEWLRLNRGIVLRIEVLFLAAFAFLALVRAANPELTSAEKPMELMFINSTLRSEVFPPRDAWLSGYAISYYYFGYVMTAMLARLTNVPGTVAHNLMTALIFGLGAIASYGILYNLLALRDAPAQPAGRRRGPTDQSPGSSAKRLALLGPFFLLIVSNIEGLLEVLYRRALLPARFWEWLDMRELTEPPTPPPGPLFERLGYWWTSQQQAGAASWLSSGLDKWFREQFMPERYLWWWRASRVVQDYDLLKNHREVIDEFPFFSFLHADLHPHVLAIPFGLLAVAVALHLFLGGWRGLTNLFGLRMHVSPTGLLFVALVLGGLAFLNTWDILIGLALILLAYVLARVREQGWAWGRLADALALAFPLALAAAALYLPFYIGFASQAGGLLPNLINPTRGAHLWVMFAPLLIPLLMWLAWLWRSKALPAGWRLGRFFNFGLVLLLWIGSWALAWFIPLIEPALAQGFLASQALVNIGQLFLVATGMRLSYIASLLTLLAVLIPASAFLLARWQAASRGRAADAGEPANERHAQHFAVLLTVLGALLVLTPEFVYLRDQFGTRLNTVFKFYYQAWMLWSLAAAFGFAMLLIRARGAWAAAVQIVMSLTLFAALIYPAFSLLFKTNNFASFAGYTLDDFDRVRRENPDEAAALEWLQSAPDGVVVEVVGDSYSGYARVSTYTGLPTVLGWPGHESQWRGGYEEQGSRRDDMDALYTTSDWLLTQSILDRYDVRYVFVGGLERLTLAVDEEKFRLNLLPVFSQGAVTIYEVP